MVHLNDLTNLLSEKKYVTVTMIFSMLNALQDVMAKRDESATKLTKDIRDTVRANRYMNQHLSTPYV